MRSNQSYSFKDRDLVLFVFSTAMVVVLYALSFAVKPIPIKAIEAGVHPYLVEWMGSAYRFPGQPIGLYVNLLVLIFFFIPKINLTERVLRLCTNRYLKFATVLTASAVLVFSLLALRSYGFTCIGLSFVFALCFFSSLKFPKASPIIILFCTLFFFVGLNYPSLLKTADFTQSGMLLVYSQGHYAMIVGPSDRIASGQKLFSEIYPVYGPLFPFLLGSFEKQFLTFLSFGQEIRLIQIFEVLFVVLSSYLYYVYNRRISISWALSSCLIAALMFAGNDEEYFVNVSPWRFAAFPLSLFAFHLVRKAKPHWRSFAMGIVSLTSVAVNFETGACISVALFLASTSYENRAQLVKTVASYVLGLVFGVAGFTLLVATIDGYCLDFKGYAQNLIQILQLSATGYLGGPRLLPSPLFVLAFGGLCYTLLKTSNADLVFTLRFRRAFSIMGLLWFSYFLSRPLMPAYLTAHIFLLGFVLIDLGRQVELLLKENKIKTLSFFVCSTLYFALAVPKVIDLNLKAFKKVSNILYQVPTQGEEISGVLVGRSAAQSLRSRADYLLKSWRNGAVFLTADSVLIPKMTGIYQKKIPEDLFMSLATEDRNKNLLEYLRINATTVLIDKPNLHSGNKYHELSFNQLREELKQNFDLVSETSDWQVWKNRSQGSTVH